MNHEYAGSKATTESKKGHTDRREQIRIAGRYPVRKAIAAHSLSAANA
jgi:hypothetical protein